MRRTWLWCVLFGLLGARASAQSARADGGPTLSPSAADLERRLDALEAENQKLRDEVQQLKDDQAFTAQQVQSVLPVQGKVSGYVDVGFFYVQGDGSGIRTDLGHLVEPRLSDVSDSWVFLGDPLATAINSRGDPADTSESRAVAFDPIHSRGKPTFIVNAINLSLFGAIGDSLTANAVIDILPRTRIISDASGFGLGDFLDAKLAYAEFKVPVERYRLSLFAGKFDSVLGYEYRAQESPDRLSVTPSLICRYTCGHPIGIKGRAQFFDDLLIVALAVTNGSSMSESFGFYTETDTNFFKTVSGRISTKLPIGSGIEIGASGSVGAQDAQDDDAVLHWHYGFDLHADWHDLELTAEFVRGRAEGKTEPGGIKCGEAPCITYRGAYGLLGYRATNWLEPYVRVDWRDAEHRSGGSFAYVSKVMRATGGLRFDIAAGVAFKAEYTWNRELGELPQIPDDIVTSSLVLRY